MRAGQDPAEAFMARTYVYIPFPAKSISDSAVTGGHKGKTVIYSNLSIFDNDATFIGRSRGHFIDRKSLLFGLTRGVRPLSVVKYEDVLEVSAHGFGGDGAATNSSQLGATVNVPSKDGGNKGTTTAAIRVDWLAQRMMKDGLTKGIRDVRLMVCYSGLE